MPKKFIRKIENFKCDNCGVLVEGNGFTNHCPGCLFSKHIDENPGDRASVCKGLMKPLRAELKNGDYILIHKCLKCGLECKNKTSPDDNLDLLLSL